MLTRRAVRFLLPAALVAGLVMAVAPWTISSRALVSALGDQLREEFGVEFGGDGRAVVAFLPLPRVKFEDISITAPDGAPLVTGGELRGRLAVGPLLYGRIVVDDIAIANARVDVAVDENGASPWDAFVAAARSAAAADAEPLAITRLGLANVQIHHHDARTRRWQVAHNVNLSLDWPGRSGRLALSGSVGLRGETVEIALRDFTPAAYLANERSPIDLRLSGRFGRLSIVGSVSRGVDSPWLTGRSSFETPAMRDLLIWSGQGLPLGPYLGAMSLEGEVSGVGAVLSWPSVRISLGADRMEGALTARLEGGRVSVNGTLAADSLALDDFAAPFMEAAAPRGPWRYRRYDLIGATAADLDLRLSATNARLRRLGMSDVALSVIVKKGRIEAALSRATMHGGVLRGRLAVMRDQSGVELRAQGSATDVDIGAAMREAGASPWLAGRGDGEFALQTRGANAAELARNAAGHVSLSARGGQIVGLALDEALRRFERQPLTASLNLHSGSTPFDEARARAEFEGGTGRIVEATIDSAALRGVAQGVILVPDRRIAARVAVESKQPVGAGRMVSALSFDVQGPWGDVSVLPDANALIQRSGAARLLLEPAARERALDALPAQ